jgi:glycosyltransferase involved in cell wall biosynthesis
VAYDAPGPRDILRDNLAGILVTSGDVDRFSAAIAEIFETSVERYQELSEQSANTALRFSWPEIARDTAEEYRKRLDELTPRSGAVASSDADA